MDEESRNVFRAVWKHFMISVCTILAYVILLMIFGNIFGFPEDFIGCLIVVLTLTNCTGYLAGKLDRILRLQDSADET